MGAPGKGFVGIAGQALGTEPGVLEPGGWLGERKKIEFFPVARSHWKRGAGCYAKPEGGWRGVSPKTGPGPTPKGGVGRGGNRGPAMRGGGPRLPAGLGENSPVPMREEGEKAMGKGRFKNGPAGGARGQPANFFCREGPTPWGGRQPAWPKETGRGRAGKAGGGGGGPRR